MLPEDRGSRSGWQRGTRPCRRLKRFLAPQLAELIVSQRARKSSKGSGALPDSAERAVKVEMAMREEAGKLITTWRRDGCELGFGAGIAQGCATLGQIGFSERSGYTAVGGYATWPPGSVSRRRMGRS
jgi:hypothetical protein